MSKQLTRKKIEKQLSKLDAGLEKSLSALVLMTALQVGPNIKKIAKTIKEPRKVVAEYVERYRKNGVFVGRFIHCDYWNKDGTGFISFITDTLVGDGLVTRE